MHRIHSFISSLGSHFIIDQKKINTIRSMLRLTGSIGIIAMISFFSFLYTRCVYANTMCNLFPDTRVSKNILGAETQVISNEKIQLEKTLTYWKKIIANHPDYEDAYVQLVIVSYQLKNDTDMRTYINFLETKNPNHSQLKKLQALLNNI